MSLGKALERAELYSTDADGKKIGKLQPGHRRVKRAPHAPKPVDEAPEKVADLWAHAKLTDEERQVQSLYGLTRRKKVKKTVRTGNLPRYFLDGYTLLEVLPLEQVEQPDGSIVEEEWCVVEGYEELHMSYDDMAEQLGLSRRQVHRRMSSAFRKLRAVGK